MIVTPNSIPTVQLAIQQISENIENIENAENAEQAMQQVEQVWTKQFLPTMEQCLEFFDKSRLDFFRNRIDLCGLLAFDSCYQSLGKTLFSGTNQKTTFGNDRTKSKNTQFDYIQRD